MDFYKHSQDQQTESINKNNASFFHVLSLARNIMILYLYAYSSLLYLIPQYFAIILSSPNYQGKTFPNNIKKIYSSLQYQDIHSLIIEIIYNRPYFSFYFYKGSFQKNKKFHIFLFPGNF